MWNLFINSYFVKTLFDWIRKGNEKWLGTPLAIGHSFRSKLLVVQWGDNWQLLVVGWQCILTESTFLANVCQEEVPSASSSRGVTWGVHRLRKLGKAHWTQQRPCKAFGAFVTSFWTKTGSVNELTNVHFHLQQLADKWLILQVTIMGSSELDFETYYRPWPLC